MIDNVSLSIDVGECVLAPEKVDDVLVVGNLEFFGCRNRRDLRTYTYKAQEANLLFTLANQTLRINNSLHKFIAGENYTDFSASQLKTAVEKIEELTGMASEKMLLHTCELALNIETELPANEYLDKFSMYRFKEFDKMRDGSVIYGIKCILSEYSIKIYDKTLQVKLQSGKVIDRNIMRFEVQYQKSRRLAGIHFLSDLLKEDKMIIAFNDYFKIFSKLRCIWLRT
jgi:hypothetical protein